MGSGDLPHEDALTQKVTIMNTCILSLVTSLALLPGGVATAQAAADPAAAVADAFVGRWLYDTHGDIIGSVRGLADSRRTAIIMVGSYFQPGSHEARVPARALSIVNGKITLRAETVAALNTRSKQ